MFLMRGLPGSGKSTIVNSEVARVLPDVVVCSADHFMMENGEYKFRPEKIASAHAKSFEASVEAATKKLPICMDKQFMNLSHMEHSLSLSEVFGYILFVLESRTPWRRQPSELSRRCVHNVPELTISGNLAKYAPMIAQNYGWFLPPAESSRVTEMAQSFFSLSLSSSSLFNSWYNEQVQGMTNQSPFESSPIDPNDFYWLSGRGSNRLYVNATLFLHTPPGNNGHHSPVDCSSKRHVYGKSRSVCSHLTSCATLRIFSMYFTPTSCGARVFVPDEVMHLCDMPGTGDYRLGVEHCSDETATLSAEEVYAMRDREMTWTPRSKTCPFSSENEVGALVHIDLGERGGAGAGRCADDLRAIVRSELEANCSTGPENLSTRTSLPDGTVLERHGDAWVVYFPEAIQIDGLFSGLYMPEPVQWYPTAADF